MSQKEINLNSINATIKNLKNFNKILLSEIEKKAEIPNERLERNAEKEISAMKPLIQFELKQRIINYQNRWFEKFELKDLVKFWIGKLYPEITSILIFR